jgi:transcriptional regulator with XRE-family HTH domain
MFGDRLKIERIKKGETQVDLAKIVDVTKQTVSRWEKGEDFPKEEKLIKIVDHYNCSLDYIMGRVDDPHLTIFEKKNINVPNKLQGENISATGNKTIDKVVLDADVWEKISTIVEEINKNNK